MELSTAKKILKVAGILSIVGGILVLILGLLAVFGSGYAAVEMPEAQTDPEYQTAAGVLLLGSVALVLSGIFTLIQGGVSVAASKNGKYATAALVFAVLSLISTLYNNIKNFSQQGVTGSSIVSLIIAVAISALICYAANTVRVAFKNDVNA